MASRVNVFVRLRPLIKSEENKEMPDCCAKRMSSKKLQLWNHRNPHNDAIEYEFDNVFDNDVTQKSIYESVKHVVPKVLDGQNATIFGYGPTGAGKTHTIVGTKQQPGLIPRCINYIFKLVKGKEIATDSKEAFSIYFSMLEIYQEKVYDLVVQKSKDLPIRQDCNGNILIPELAEVKVDSFGEFVTKYEAASNKKTIGSTNLNARSSRSHTILLVKVVKTHCENPSKKYLGKLHLIDLAGSEDNRRTGNSGVRLKESGAINSSLFSLSMVVDALNKGLQRVPYRDSKLTRLLQDSIGGSAHSVMIACIAPEPSFYWDTLNTLKFASKSREVVNKPFTKVVHDRSLKRPCSEEGGARAPKRPATEETKIPKNANKENPSCVSLADNVKKILDPLGKRQDEMENKFDHRLKVLEDLIAKNQTKPTQSRYPLSVNTKANIPVGKVKPLMKKCQPALNETPSAKESIVVDTPPPAKRTHGNQGFFKKADAAVSLPHLIENGRTPKYGITLDPKLHEECDEKVLNILNNGTMKDIMGLPTIGKKRAEQIINSREENGQFSSMSDLLKAGFSQAMLQNFKKKYVLQRLVIS